MMYSDKLVLAVKSNGKILREFKDTVYVPFGSEYSLLIKNLNNRRVIVDISIDGTPVTRGGLVIAGGQEVDLERYITENKERGNRFKFIERSDSVEKNRGTKLEDGLIRASFRFESESIYWYTEPKEFYKRSGPDLIGSRTTGSVYLNSINCSSNVRGFCHDSAPANEVGITVPGSISEQKFVNANWFPTELQEHVIVLRMLGVSNGKKVVEPVTVQHKPKCITCGRVNKATAKFCSNCGTSLEIV